MTKDNIELDQLIRTTIEDLVDFDLDELNHETKLADIGLVSLDYVTLDVAYQKKYGQQIDLDAMEKSDIETYAEFINFIAQP